MDGWMTTMTTARLLLKYGRLKNLQKILRKKYIKELRWNWQHEKQLENRDKRSLAYVMF